MTENFWPQLSSVYRSKANFQEKLKNVLMILSEFIPCEACSIFLFDEYEGSLKFILGTNIKPSISIPAFRSDSPLWKMLEVGKPSKVAEQQHKGLYPTTDVFFENIHIVKSIAFSVIYDDKNNKTGIIRLLNKTKDDKTVCDFSEQDLLIIETFANIIGQLIAMSTLRSKYEAFLDSVTHELLAPISGIKNASHFMQKVTNMESLSEDTNLQGSFFSKIDDIFRFSQQAISLVQGLTMYTKSGRMSKSDLVLKHSHLFSDVIDKCRGSLTPLLRSRNFEHAAIRCFDRSKWPLLNIDRKIFHQVFNNILSNSIKYAYEDEKAFNIIIELDTLQNGDAVIIIQDYGIGLHQDEVEKIFDPTFRGKHARERVPTGPGIGLTTVRNLLLAHECNIKVTNLKNPTEFTITIPKKYVIRRTK